MEGTRRTCGYKMSQLDCFWDIYDDNARTVLGVGLFIAGTISFILPGLLLASLVKNRLLENRSHWMLMNICLACLGRSAMAGFLFSGTSAVGGRWLFGEWSCTYFGFLNQFLTVYLIEAITHMCIERYVVAKYMKYSWEMTTSRYILFFSLCCMFATLYSVPTLLGVGGYSLDFSCTHCTFNILLPNHLVTKYAVLAILFLQNVKPVFFWVSMLHWAGQIETLCYNENDHKYKMLLTKTCINVTKCAFTFWTPCFLASAWVVTSQLFNETVSTPPLVLTMLAAFGSEITPAAIVATILCTNKPLRDATLGIFMNKLHEKKK